MGTLVFHIALFSAFLLADVDIKGDVKEEAMLIEFPDLPEEPELPEEEPESTQQEASDLAPDNQQSNMASNRTAVENTTTSTDEFFDDDYLQELEAAKQLRSSVNSNLSKEITDMSDIEMPVETTEGMDKDSIKNVVYTGDSNISFFLENRHVIRYSVPVYLTQSGGMVIVDIQVNREGQVVKATARADKSIRDKQIFLYAQEAASRTRFNNDPNAPSIQKGTIHYTFVAQ